MNRLLLFTIDLHPTCHCIVCVESLREKIRNERARGSVKLAPVTKKVTEKRLKRYGHVKTSEEVYVLRRMLDATVPGKRRRGRQKTRWNYSCKRYMESGESK